MRIIKKNIGFMLFCLVILILTLRGLPGNPDSSELNTETWIKNGPFVQRGRFALTYSLIEDKSFHFSNNIAHFSLPDLGYTNGKYVSLFAPGVAFITIPGYLVGRYFGASQVGTFFVISIFAVFNALLVRNIAKYFGAGRISSTLSSIAFLFATPAFTYGVDLYQHHVSTFLILLGVKFAFTKGNIFKHFLLWTLFGIAIVVDYPNFFLMLPIIIYSLAGVISTKIGESDVKISIGFGKIAMTVGIILPLLFLFWFNNKSNGSMFTLSGAVENVREMDSRGNPIRRNKEGEIIGDNLYEESGESQQALTFFKTRNLVNGLYVHIFSPDRGIIYFAPITLFGVLGLLELTNRKKQASLILTIVVVNLILYSMWGDPWGGWAFGSRYLIPSYALLAPFVGVAVTKSKKDSVFMAMIALTFFYSVSVNSLGAVTSNANPPTIEIEYLSSVSNREEKYSYDRNLDYLVTKGSQSYFYNKYLKNWIKPWQFYFVLVVVLVSVITASIFHLNNFRYNSVIDLALKTDRSGKSLKIYFGIVDSLKTLPKGIKFW